MKLMQLWMKTVDTYENKDKAALILAQIQDKIHSK